MRIAAFVVLAASFLNTGCGRTPGPASPLAEEPKVPEQPKSDPTPGEPERSKPAARSALEIAEKYVRSVKDGAPKMQLATETKAAFDRRSQDSPDRPLYSYTAWKISPQEVAPGRAKVTFQGQADVNHRSLGPFTPWGVGTGGTATFMIELVRDAEKGWLVDDFRFQPRPPQIAAVTSREVWLAEVRSEVGDALLRHYDVKEMEAKLGLKAWVFYCVGDNVQLRLQIEQTGRKEKGKKESLEHTGLKMSGPESRACLLVFQDVRRDDPTRLNPSLVMRMSHNSQFGHDVPYLWYGWKGVRFDEKTFDGKLTPGEEARILEVQAVETGHAEGDEPRRAKLTLYAKLLAAK